MHVKYKRYSISFPTDIANQLEKMSKALSKSISSIVVEKVEASLEFEDDIHWMQLIKEREPDIKRGRTLSLKDIWNIIIWK